MGRYRVHPKVDQRNRLLIMNTLRERHEKAKFPSQEWVEVKAEFGTKMDYPGQLLGSMKKSGLVELKHENLPRKGKVAFVRITPEGLHRLAQGQLLAIERSKAIMASRDIDDFFVAFANKYKVKARTGREYSVKGVLEKIISRPVEFERWYRAMFVEGV